MEERADVVVLSATGPEHFHVLLEALIAQEQEFAEKIHKEAEISTIPEVFKKGEIYFGKHRDGKWYRVKIKKLDTSSSQHEVCLIDYGNVFKMEESNLRTCQGTVRLLRARALKCSLMNAEQLIDAGSDVNMFKFLVSRRKPMTMVVRDVRDETFIVDLITRKRVQNYSLFDFLVSRLNNLQVNKTCNPKTVKQLEIKTGDAVKLRHINSPGDFFVCSVDMEPDEQVMREEMKSFYQTNPLNFMIITEGVIAATPDEDGIWHRVEVLEEVAPKETFKVMFIDTGKEVLSHMDELFELDIQFYDFPRFAKRCSLSGIDPLDETWSEESTAFFRERLTDRQNVMEIEEEQDGVKLFVYYRGLKINCNMSLVHFRLAKLKPGTSGGEPFETIKDYDDDTLKEGGLNAIEIVNKKDLNPFNFQVRFLEYAGAVDTMTQQIQTFTSSSIEVNSWKVGDKCLAHCSLDEDEKNELWLRGVVKRVEDSKALVVLSDHGTKLWKPFEKLRPCPQEFMEINSTVETAKLACSVNGTWDREDSIKLQKLIECYSKLFIAFKDNNAMKLTDSRAARPAILWGQSKGGPVKNVLKDLESQGLVEPTFEEKSIVDLQKKDWTMMDLFNEEVVNKIDLEGLPGIDGDKISIGDYVVELKKKKVKKWLEAPPKLELNFFAIGTNVDAKGRIVLHDMKDEDDLNTVNTIAQRFFKGPPEVKSQFQAGDPCMVKIDDDNLFYRGKVIEVVDEVCSVEFIDYGNVQRGVKSKYLHAEVICHEVPPFARKYKLHGTPRQIEGKIDQSMLDKLHALIVDVSFEVRVNKDDMKQIPKGLKRCAIVIDGKLIRSYGKFEDEFEMQFEKKS